MMNLKHSSIIDGLSVSRDSSIISEAVSGVGTEIGLSIDKENCESTSISGIATPDGKVVVYRVKKKKTLVIKESNDKDESTDEGETEKTEEKQESEKTVKTGKEDKTRGAVKTIVCPECGSKNVNVVGVDRFLCSDCNHEWRDTNYDNINDDKVEKDGMLDNSEDEPPIKKYISTNSISIY